MNFSSCPSNRFCGFRSVKPKYIDLSRRHKVRAIQSIESFLWRSHCVANGGDTILLPFLPKFPFFGSSFLSERRRSRHTGFPKFFRAPFPAEKIANKSDFSALLLLLLSSIRYRWYGAGEHSSGANEENKSSIENEIPLSPQKTCFNLLIFNCDCVFTVFPNPRKKNPLN